MSLLSGGLFAPLTHFPVALQFVPTARMDADKAQLARLRDRIAESKMNFDAWAGEVEDSMLSTRTQHVERVATDKGKTENRWRRKNSDVLGVYWVVASALLLRPFVATAGFSFQPLYVYIYVRECECECVCVFVH